MFEHRDDRPHTLKRMTKLMCESGLDQANWDSTKSTIGSFHYIVELYLIPRPHNRHLRSRKRTHQR